MNSKVRRVIDQIHSESLYSHNIVYGNLNDFINSLCTISPNITPDEVEEIIKNLELNGVVDGDKIKVLYSKTKDDESIYSYQLGEMFINFNSLT